MFAKNKIIVFKLRLIYNFVKYLCEGVKYFKIINETFHFHHFILFCFNQFMFKKINNNV